MHYYHVGMADEYTSDSRDWQQIIAQDPTHSRRYAARWREFSRQGRDIVGEARLVDAIAPRHARILDAGCGQGRLAHHLADAGHVVTGVDVDAFLITEAQRIAQHRGLTHRRDEAPQFFQGDLADLPDDVRQRGPFDLIFSAGNVFPFIAVDQRAQAVAQLGSLLADDGRLLIGFGSGRGYPFSTFFSDVETAGLVVQSRFSSWDLQPFEAETSDFLVALCARR